METHHLVLPGDLNQYGSLFGGRLLSWVDEAAWIAASAEFPHCQFVTIAMDKVEFRHGVGDGTILRIACERTNRQARLVELDPRYCDVIVKRWEGFTGKKAERRSA